MDNGTLIALAAPMALVLGGLIGAAISRWLSDSDNEWRELAEVRGAMNQDHEKRIKDLETTVGELGIRLQTVMDFKAVEIASLVVEGVKAAILPEIKKGQ